MAEFSLELSGYGHFGLLTYHPRKRAWYFRSPPGLHRSRLSISPPLRLLDGSADDPPEYVFLKSRIRNDTNVTDTHPHLTGLFRFLDPELIASWAVSAFNRSYNPAVGRLLGIGCITTADGESVGPVPIFASVDGPCGTRLRISALQMQESSLETRNKLISVPMARPSSITYDLKVPISQVHLSSPMSTRGMKYGQLLALRLEAKTAIVEIKSHFGIEQTPNKLPNTALCFGQISCSPIMEIQSGDRRDCHADVSFNPWCNAEIAIIDVSGIWGVFDVMSQEQLKVSGLKGPKPIISGSVSKELEVIMDGWARISWITNPHTFAMCTRTHISFYHALGQMTVPFSNIHAIPSESNWYIDVQITGVQKHHMFILTSSQLLWITVGVSENLSSRNFAINPFILSVSRHYRDPNDMSMRLEVVPRGSEYIVIISSKHSLELTCYRFSYMLTENDVSTFSSNPTQITLPSSFVQGIRDLDIQMQDNNDGIKTSTHQSARYTVTVLLEDYSLWTTTLDIGRHGYDETFNQNMQPKSPGPIAQNPRFPQTFIIPDDSDDDKQPFSGSSPRDPFIERRVKRNTREHPRPYFNMNSVYQQLIDLRSPVQSQCSFDNEPSDLAGFESHMQDVDLRQPSKTILEISKPFNVSDIDEVSNVLSSVPLLIRADAANSLQSSPIPDLLPSLRWGEISQDFDQLLEHFVGTLASSTPLQYRRRRYSIALSIITELRLAALRAPVSIKATKQPSQIALPIHSSPVKRARRARQALPALSMRNSQPSSSRLQDIREETPLEESTASEDKSLPPEQSPLAKYIRLTKILPSANSGTTRLLSHWTPGADPHHYDFLWQLAKDDKAREWAQMTEEQRRQQRKREEQLVRAQEQESQRFMQMTQTQNEDPFAGSSQRPRGTQARESQSLLKAALASQVELEGTQVASPSPSKRKKKKRVKGF